MESGDRGSDQLLNFCEMTGANPDLAQKYLTVSEYDIERAIALFFENGGADLTAPREPEPELPVQREERQWENPFVRVERQMMENSYRGSFANAREFAKSKKKLIIAVIYDETEFHSFTFNRDILTSSDIQQFIKENFVLFYMRAKTTEAQRHLTFYPSEKYPYVALIDPLTGERIKVWSHVPTESEFMQDAYDQIERHHFTKVEPEIVQPQVVPVQPNVIPKVEPEPVTQDDIRAVLFGSIEAKDHPEPNSGDLTRIQFIRPDGSRIVRKFAKSDQVRVVFEWLKTKISEPFDLKSFRQDLLDKVDESISDAGLANATVNIDYM